MVLPDVHHQADLPLGVDGAAEHQEDVVHLPTQPQVAAGPAIGDEAGGALEQVADDPQVVRPERVAGLGHLDDRVGQKRRLDLGRAPTELDVALTPCSASQRLVRLTTSVAIRFPSRSLTDWMGESVGTASTQRTGR